MFFSEQDNSTNQSKAEEKSRVYYRSCLDKNETIEKLGPKPMQDFLKQVSLYSLLINNQNNLAPILFVVKLPRAICS